MKEFRVNFSLSITELEALATLGNKSAKAKVDMFYTYKGIVSSVFSRVKDLTDSVIGLGNKFNEEIRKEIINIFKNFEMLDDKNVKFVSDLMLDDYKKEMSVINTKLMILQKILEMDNESINNKRIEFGESICLIQLHTQSIRDSLGSRLPQYHKLK